MRKSDYRSIAIILTMFLCIALAFVYGQRENNRKKQKTEFNTKIASLGYADSLTLDELSNPFIIKCLEKQLNDFNSDSIYLGNRLCKRIDEYESHKRQTYLLSRDNRSIFKVDISKEKLNPEFIGRLVRISVICK